MKFRLVYHKPLLTNRYFILLIFLIVMPALLNAQTEEENLMDMSLEDLLKIEIVTASQKVQEIQDAPADMIVITEQMIKLRGYKDLKDIFRDLPGLDISENVEGEVRTLVISRGILGNNKIMVLQDGKKLNVTTGERFVYGNNLPLFNIKRIEIIYGPSSAIYGADAYSGVINMISKDPEDVGGIEFNLSYGTNNTFDASLLMGTKVSDTMSVVVGFRKYNTDGEDPSNFEEYESLGIGEDDIDMPTDNYNFYGKVMLNNLTIGLYRMDADEPNGYSTNPDTEGGWYTLDDTYVWHQVINKLYADHLYTYDKWDITSSFEYSDYEVKNESNFHYVWGYQYKYANTNSIKWEEKINYQATDKLGISGGFVIEKVNSFPKTANLNTKFDDDILVDDMSDWYVDGRIFGLDDLTGAAAFGVRPFWKYGVYVEGTQKIKEQFQVNLGIRYDKASNYDPDNVYNMINPRLGFIWHPQNTTVKLMYGEAYIQPSEYDKWENFVAGNFLAHIPNPNLESENLRSFMGVIGQQIGQNFYGELSVYHNQLEDIIRPTQYTEQNDFVDEIMTDPNAFIETNDNVGEQTTQGLELKLRYQTAKLQAYFYYSYLSAEEKNGDPISKVAPNKIHGGLTYIMADTYSISPRFRWIDKANGLTATGVEEGFIDSKFVFDVNLRASNFFNGLSAYVNVLNLLDEEYYGPAPFGEGPSGWIMAKAPQPGRTIEFGLNYRY